MRGLISAERVDEAVRRVLRLKLDAGFTTEPRVGKAIVGAEENRAVELTVARRAVSVVRDRGGLLPLRPSTPITLINTTLRSAYDVLTQTRGIGPNQATAAFDVFAQAMAENCSDLRVVAAEEYAAGAIPGEGVVVAVSENYTLPGMDFDQSRQAEIIGSLHESAGERLLVVALRDPYELAEFPEIGTYICAYSFRPCAAQAAAEVSAGRDRSARSHAGERAGHRTSGLIISQR